MTVLRSLCAYTHDMEPVHAKEERSGARVHAVAWGGPLMPHSVRAWDVEVVCAGTGAAGTSAAGVGRAHTCLGHLSQACAVMDLGLRHPPAGHLHINGI